MPPSRVEGVGLVKGARLPLQRTMSLEHGSLNWEAGNLTSVLGLLSEKGLLGKGGIFARISEISWREGFVQFPAGL